jgi:hypothetical protein
MKKPKVINIRTGEHYDVYIGRAGKGEEGYFGNPVTEGTRSEKIKGFRNYAIDRVNTDNEYRQKVKALSGKTLGCFCKPSGS